MQFRLFWESSSTYQTWIITGWHGTDVYSSCDFKLFSALQFDNQDDQTQPRMFVYVEAWPSVEGDGMLSGTVLSWLRSQPISWILWNYILHITSLIFLLLLPCEVLWLHPFSTGQTFRLTKLQAILVLYSSWRTFPLSPTGRWRHVWIWKICEYNI